MDLNFIKHVFGNQVALPETFTQQPVQSRFVITTAAEQAAKQSQGAKTSVKDEGKSDGKGKGKLVSKVDNTRNTTRENVSGAPDFRFVPTCPGFTRATPREDGYRVAGVVPSFVKKAMPGLVDADGNFGHSSKNTALLSDESKESKGGKKSEKSEKGKSSDSSGDQEPKSGSVGKKTNANVQFDDKGYPTTDENGEPLTKNQYKKMARLIDAEKKKNEKKLAAQAAKPV